MRHRVAILALSGLLLTSGLLTSPATAAVAARVSASAQVASTITTVMPLLRIHFTTTIAAVQLPPLHLQPALATKWQQIGPRDVQAVALDAPAPAVSYAIDVPTLLSCASTCRVLRTHTVTTTVNVNVTWEAQLLAELNYLPVRFSATDPSASPVAQDAGSFTWRFPHLPTSLQTQWSSTSDNVILDGALMNFQNVHGLPTTGVMNPATWNTLVHAVTHHDTDPATYNYVDVTETSPEVLHLYLNGVETMSALINTGIPYSPTALGTFPVYLRYTSQTMTGLNPNGTRYVDPGIPWVSYFHGGDALHGYIRASYGFPQSLGCVEMPFATAGLVWPHTPIGTLVTVRP